MKVVIPLLWSFSFPIPPDPHWVQDPVEPVLLPASPLHSLHLLLFFKLATLQLPFSHTVILAFSGTCQPCSSFLWLWACCFSETVCSTLFMWLTSQLTSLLRCHLTKGDFFDHLSLYCPPLPFFSLFTVLIKYIFYLCILFHTKI